MWATPLVSLSVSIRGLWKSYWDISSNHEHSDLWEKAICRQEYNKRVVYSKLQCIRMHHGVLSDWSLDWDPKKKALESDWLSRAFFLRSQSGDQSDDTPWRILIHCSLLYKPQNVPWYFYKTFCDGLAAINTKRNAIFYKPQNVL